MSVEVGALNSVSTPIMVDGEKAGYVQLSEKVPGVDGAVLYNINIDPPFRARGIGRKVVEIVEARLRKKGIQMLWLNDVEPTAYGFWEALGYSSVEGTHDIHDDPMWVKDLE